MCFAERTNLAFFRVNVTVSDVMSTKPVMDVLSTTVSTEERWQRVQNLVALNYDMAKYEPAYRANPAAGIGIRFTGLQTHFLRSQLLSSPEVKSTLFEADSAQPLALRLSHPYKLSLITTSTETEIPLTEPTQKIAGELLNRMFMPKGATIAQIRAAWAFRSVLLPIPDRAPAS
jgi:hypothetical protein